jgi:O-antigen ligase
MHFAWLARLLQIGIVGTALLALCFVVYFVRSIQAFLVASDPLLKGVILGIFGATVGVLSFDMLHTLLPRDPALPVIALWSVTELVFYWSRRNENG